jgi:hypothetical protein
MENWRLMPRSADVETAAFGDTGYNFMLGGFNSQHTKSQPARRLPLRARFRSKKVHIAAGEFGIDCSLHCLRKFQ